MHISPWSGALTIQSSPAAGQPIHFKLTREVDDGDDLTDDVEIWGIEVEFTNSRLGSVNRT